LTWAEPGSGSSATIATLACAAGTTQTICVPTSDGSPGGYTLEVSAPGFQAVTVPASVSFPIDTCTCGGATLLPSAVTLSPL
jgi:hypothetical protein